MVISDKQLNQFQTLCEKRTGVRPSKKEAYEQAIKLLSVLDISYKEIKKADLKRVEERQAELSSSSLQL